MLGSSRARMVLSVMAVAVVATLGLAACGKSGADQVAGTDAGSSDLGWDAQALQSIGFSMNDLTLAAAQDVTPAPSASPGGTRAGSELRRLHHRLTRFGFGRPLSHGEAMVQTDEGTKTVVVQRRVVTAITGTSVTVKSLDGYTLTWTFGNPFTVIKNHTKINPSEVAVGTKVGIAGARNGTETDARLMVVART